MKLARIYKDKFESIRVLTGGPRHHKVRCLGGCGWHGFRTCDADRIADAPPCPRCGSGLKLVARA